MGVLQLVSTLQSFVPSHKRYKGKFNALDNKDVDVYVFSDMQDSPCILSRCERSSTQA